MKKKISIFIATLLISIMGLTTACNSKGVVNSKQESQKQETKIIKNVDGKEIKVPTNVKKVAAVFGPSYEKVVMLGAEDKLAAIGDFHKKSWPWSNVVYKRINELEAIPNAHSGINVEDLVKNDIDLVFNFPNPNTTQAMEKAGIAVVPMASTGKLSDIKDSVLVYANALGGDAISIAEKYAKYFDEKVKMVKERTANIDESKKPKVYFSNQEILWTAGKKSDIPELIEVAGGKCVSKDVDGSSKVEISKEQLIKWDPNYIFIDHAGSSGNDSAEKVISNMSDSKDYESISAIKNKNVFIVPTGVFFWDSGVQKPLMLMYIAKTLYPEKFSDIDMDKELKAFYSEFFHYKLTDNQAEKILKHQNP